MIENFVSPSGKIMNNCTPCKMEHHQILRFILVVKLKTVFLVGGLDVEDKLNGLRVIYFYGAELRRNFCIKRKIKL
jgi:hypothetical protein